MFKTPEECIKEMYPEVEYDQETLIYTYRGFTFYAFHSGICMNTGQFTYLLKDAKYPWVWLFTYGEKEDRWTDYLDNRAFNEKLYLPKKKTWFGYIKETLGL